MTKLTRYEMETTINFNMEEKTAVLYTRDRNVMRRMDALVSKFPDIYRLTEETDIGKTYEFPKKYAMPRRPRILSEEQKDAMRERFSSVRARQDDKEGADL